MWFFVVCTLIDDEYASLLFSQAFFELFLHIKVIPLKLFYYQTFFETWRD